MAALLGAIVLVFGYVVAGLFATPKSATNDEAAKADVETGAPVRSEEMARFFKRAMNIHERIMGPAKTGDVDRVENYRDLIPELGDNAAKPDGLGGFDASFAMPAMPAPRPPREQEEDEEEDRSSSTGWGWLADDIAEGRQQNDKKNGANEQGDIDNEEANANERDTASLARGNENEKTPQEKMFFIDPTFERPSRSTDTALVPLRESQDGGAVFDGENDFDPNRMNTSDGVRDMNADAGRRAGGESPFAIRDPFPLNENSPRWIRETPTAESVFGFQRPEEPVEAPSRIESMAGDDFSASMPVGMQTPSSSYSPVGGSTMGNFESDAIFKANDGYTPLYAPADSGGFGSAFGSGFDSPASAPSSVAAPQAPAPFERTGPSALPW